MTSRRLVHLATALLDPAISLGFWLIGWIATGSSAAGAEGARDSSAYSILTVDIYGFRATVDPGGVPARIGHALVSPAALRTAACNRPSIAAGVGGSSASRSEQIPLSVGALGALRSALSDSVFPSRRGLLGRRSLNPTLSLHGGVA